jgi:hypothetical protein
MPNLYFLPNDLVELGHKREKFENYKEKTKNAKKFPGVKNFALNMKVKI